MPGSWQTRQLKRQERAWLILQLQRQYAGPVWVTWRVLDHRPKRSGLSRPCLQLNGRWIEFPKALQRIMRYELASYSGASCCRTELADDWGEAYGLL